MPRLTNKSKGNKSNLDKPKMLTLPDEYTYILKKYAEDMTTRTFQNRINNNVDLTLEYIIANKWCTIRTFSVRSLLVKLHMNNYKSFKYKFERVWHDNCGRPVEFIANIKKYNVTKHSKIANDYNLFIMDIYQYDADAINMLGTYCYTYIRARKKQFDHNIKKPKKVKTCAKNDSVINKKIANDNAKLSMDSEKSIDDDDVTISGYKFSNQNHYQDIINTIHNHINPCIDNVTNNVVVDVVDSGVININIDIDFVNETIINNDCFDFNVFDNYNSDVFDDNYNLDTFLF